MDRPKLKTVLIGFGRIAQGNASDERMAKLMKYSTHAQVLKDHPHFDWQAVVDTRPEARAVARSDWNISQVCSKVADLAAPETFEIAVIATPPSERPAVIEELRGLKGVLVEKPLGTDLSAAKKFLVLCDQRKIKVQVNLLRRADVTTRLLRGTQLDDLVGNLQAILAFYSHGLLNNGVHVVDLARMLLRSEVAAVQAMTHRPSFDESPIKNDLNVAFNLFFESGQTVTFNPLKLSCYRENGMEFWGEKGRLSYLHSGFSIFSEGVEDSSLVSGEKELQLSAVRNLPITLGTAFYEMYSNLAEAVQLGEQLLSPGASTVATMAVIDRIKESFEQGGKVVSCESISA